jgi:hypothetical protein
VVETAADDDDDDDLEAASTPAAAASIEVVQFHSNSKLASEDEVINQGDRLSLDAEADQQLQDGTSDQQLQEKSHGTSESLIHKHSPILDDAMGPNEVDEREELTWIMVEQISVDYPLQPVAVPAVDCHLTSHQDQHPSLTKASAVSFLRIPRRRLHLPPAGYGWMTGVSGCWILAIIAAIAAIIVVMNTTLDSYTHNRNVSILSSRDVDSYPLPISGDRDDVFLIGDSSHDIAAVGGLCFGSTNGVGMSSGTNSSSEEQFQRPPKNEMTKSRERIVVDLPAFNVMESDVDPTASVMIEADVDPTASVMIEVDVDPTASDMIEAHVDRIASGMIEADVDPTASVIIEVDVDRIASDMIEADVDPTALDMLDTDVGPIASDMIQADVGPTAFDMIEADIDRTESDMMEDIGPTASVIIEVDVGPTASDMLDTDVGPTASDIIEADIDPTASDIIEADVDPTASDTMERDASEPQHAMRRGWRDVLLSICVCSLLVALLRASLSTPPAVTPQPLHGYSEHHQPIVAKSADMMPSFSPERKSLGIYKHTRSVTRDKGTRYTRRRSVSSQLLLQERHVLFPSLQVDGNLPNKRHAHFA